jgi:hypothetical protein
MDPIEILIKEYETLRQEILATIDSRNSILSFGLATIGAIFTGSVISDNIGSSPPFTSLILMLAVPSISGFVLFLWLGEYQRMQRAGKFLVNLEQKINELASKELLTWETKLRVQRVHMRYPYHATVLLLTVISFISLLIGILTSGFSYAPFLIFLSLGALIHIAAYFYVVSVIANLRR